MFCAGCGSNQQPQKTVWFDKPAKYFEEALPLGNGFIGMMVKGGAPKEDLILNESSLWTGGPVDPNMNPDAWKNLESVRKALFSENYKLAENLVKKMQGSFSQSYAPLGNLLIAFNHSDSITNYKRVLDLSTGIAKVDYSSERKSFHREFFVSNPDRVAVIYLKGDSPESMSFTISSTSLLRYSTRTENNDFIMDGVAPVHAEPNYNRNVKEPIVYDTTGKGTRFRMIARVLKTDGKTFTDSAGLHVEKASETIIILSVGTSFNGFDKDPGLQGKDEKKSASDFLEKASRLSYDELKNRHTGDFSALFNRVSFSVNNAVAPNLPTNQRLINYKDSASDPELEALYFQFGRYLLISSSRPGGIPANLQGIWNPHIRPPWSSNYTANINSEMNYWPAEVTNLSQRPEK
jgi:alpha-L-fucosidase 2